MMAPECEGRVVGQEVLQMAESVVLGCGTTAHLVGLELCHPVFGESPHVLSSLTVHQTAWEPVFYPLFCFGSEMSTGE